jgi:hypothetical protein
MELLARTGSSAQSLIHVLTGYVLLDLPETVQEQAMTVMMWHVMRTSISVFSNPELMVLCVMMGFSARRWMNARAASAWGSPIPVRTTGSTVTAWNTVTKVTTFVITQGIRVAGSPVMM